MGRLGTEGGVRRSDRRAKIARLQAEIARLESVRAEAASHIPILDEKIELYTVRAPISGRIGNIINLQPGAVVSAGTRLGTVIPAGGVRAVAFFDVATALGRVKPGQPARIRLFGFPWTKFGVLRARVERVGSEPRDGLIRVELALAAQQKAHIPVEHGLQGSAEVEVEAGGSRRAGARRRRPLPDELGYAGGGEAMSQVEQIQVGAPAFLRARDHPDFSHGLWPRLSQVPVVRIRHQDQLWPSARSLSHQC